jgi:hypothetical protein
LYDFSGLLLGSAFQQLDVKFSLGVIEGVDPDVSVLGFEETDIVFGAVEQLFLAHNFTNRDDGVLRNKDAFNQKPPFSLANHPVYKFHAYLPGVALRLSPVVLRLLANELQLPLYRHRFLIPIN